MNKAPDACTKLAEAFSSKERLNKRVASVWLHQYSLQELEHTHQDLFDLSGGEKWLWGALVRTSAAIPVGCFALVCDDENDWDLEQGKTPAELFSYRTES